jgi:hypothetical protein
MQRIEKGYNFQTSKPSDIQPALIDIGVFTGFKHTVRLSYGVGAAISIGLGEGWNRVQLSYQGVAARSYIKWKGVYGIDGYAGYERKYGRPAFKEAKSIAPTFLPPGKRTESILLGIQKSYNISKKWQGAIQVLFDAFWRQNQASGPFCNQNRNQSSQLNNYTMR